MQGVESHCDRCGSGHGHVPSLPADQKCQALHQHSRDVRTNNYLCVNINEVNNNNNNNNNNNIDMDIDNDEDSDDDDDDDDDGDNDDGDDDDNVINDDEIVILTT